MRFITSLVLAVAATSIVAQGIRKRSETVATRDGIHRNQRRAFQVLQARRRGARNPPGPDASKAVSGLFGKLGGMAVSNTIKDVLAKVIGSKPPTTGTVSPTTGQAARRRAFFSGFFSGKTKPGPGAIVKVSSKPGTSKPATPKKPWMTETRKKQGKNIFVSVIDGIASGLSGRSLPENQPRYRSETKNRKRKALNNEILNELD